MMVFSKEKERRVQVTCEVSEELNRKLNKIKEKKGKKKGWLVKRAIEKFNKGELVI